jgi:hypothetical protein
VGAANVYTSATRSARACQLKLPSFGLPREATDLPLTVSDLNLSLGSKYCMPLGNPYEAAPGGAQGVEGVGRPRRRLSQRINESGCLPYENVGAFERVGV